MSFNRRFSPRGSSSGPKGPQKPKVEVLEKIDVKVPLTTAAKLRELSNERKVPMTHMVNYAIDNEFDLEFPFNYPVELPAEFSKLKNIEEMARIDRYMKHIYPAGFTLPMLVYLRRDMRIDSKAIFLEALANMIEMGTIEAYTHSRSTFEFAPGVKHYRWIDTQGTQVSALTEREKLLARLAELNKTIDGEEA